MVTAEGVDTGPAEALSLAFSGKGKAPFICFCPTFAFAYKQAELTNGTCWPLETVGFQLMGFNTS